MIGSLLAIVILVVPARATHWVLNIDNNIAHATEWSDGWDHVKSKVALGDVTDLNIKYAATSKGGRWLALAGGLAHNGMSQDKVRVSLYDLQGKVPGETHLYAVAGIEAVRFDGDALQFGLNISHRYPQRDSLRMCSWIPGSPVRTLSETPGGIEDQWPAVRLRRSMAEGFLAEYARRDILPVFGSEQAFMDEPRRVFGILYGSQWGAISPSGGQAIARTRVDEHDQEHFAVLTGTGVVDIHLPRQTYTRQVRWLDKEITIACWTKQQILLFDSATLHYKTTIPGFLLVDDSV